jgi:hypothetical protein
MKMDDVQIFLLPLCGFSYEESQNLSLVELNRLWEKGEITKYKLPGFLRDVNDDMLVDNTNNWIVMREEENQEKINTLKGAV